MCEGEAAKEGRESIDDSIDEGEDSMDDGEWAFEARGDDGTALMHAAAAG